MTTVPVAEALPAIWMISDEDYESIMETLDVLADAAAMQDIAQ